MNSGCGTTRTGALALVRAAPVKALGTQTSSRKAASFSQDFGARGSSQAQ